MSRKERSFVIEGLAIATTFLCLLFVIPTMINIRDSFAVIVAGIMAGGAVGWVVYFLYRLERDFK